MAALLVMLAVLTVRDRFSDPDMWWHLKNGQVIATTHHIPQTDIYSYSTNHHFYIPHEWLSQLFIYAAYALHGYTGLMLWEAGLTAAILLTGFWLCSLYSGNRKLGLLGAVLIWFFGTIGFAVRPQMIGYLLLLFELIVLHLGRNRSSRWFLFLLPLFATWVNCHASFVFGLAVAAAYLVSSFFVFDKGPIVAPQWNAASRRTLGLSVLGSLFAILLNPTGLRLILYPVKMLYIPSVSMAAVTEWQPLALNQGRALGLLAVLVLIALLVGSSRVKLYLHEALVLGAATWLALNHARLLFPFGIVVAPVLARLVTHVWHDEIGEQHHPVANASIIVAALAVSYAGFPSPANLDSQVRRFSPASAVDYIRSHHLTGPMMNEWRDGGYLIWALPEHPVFIDGRADVYDWAGVTPQYGRWATLAETPNLLLDRYHVQFCLVDKDSQMNAAMSLLSDWRRVYSDDVSVIFVRSSASGS